MFIFVFEDEDNNIVIRQRLGSDAHIEDVIEMFIRFLLANEYGMNLISEYISLGEEYDLSGVEDNDTD